MSLIRTWAAALAAIVSLTWLLGASAATVGSDSYVVVATNGPTSTGPLFADLVATATLADLADGRITASASLGGGGSAGGYMTENGVTFAALAKAPNDKDAPLLNRGGFVKVFVERYFLKVTEDAELDYVFSGFVVSTAHDPEFGPRCPTGRNDCQQAGWRSVATTYKLDGSATEQQTFFAEVGSDPNSARGYYFAEDTPFLLLDVVAGLYGASIVPTVSQNPAFSNVGLASLSLEDIAAGEVFRATLELTAWAYDGGSNIGPLREAFTFVQDPLDPDLGIGFMLDGVEAVAAVPEPPMLWTMAAGLLLLWRRAQRRRRGSTPAVLEQLPLWRARRIAARLLAGARQAAAA